MLVVDLLPKKVACKLDYQLISLEVPVPVQSLKSSNVELGWDLEGRLFKCCLSTDSNLQRRLDLICRLLALC